MTEFNRRLALIVLNATNADCSNTITSIQPFSLLWSLLYAYQVSIQCLGWWRRQTMAIGLIVWLNGEKWGDNDSNQKTDLWWILIPAASHVDTVYKQSVIQSSSIDDKPTNTWRIGAIIIASAEQFKYREIWFLWNSYWCTHYHLSINKWY